MRLQTSPFISAVFLIYGATGSCTNALPPLCTLPSLPPRCHQEGEACRYTEGEGRFKHSSYDIKDPSHGPNPWINQAMEYRFLDLKDDTIKMSTVDRIGSFTFAKSKLGSKGITPAIHPNIDSVQGTKWCLGRHLSLHPKVGTSYVARGASIVWILVCLHLKTSRKYLPCVYIDHI